MTDRIQITMVMETITYIRGGAERVFIDTANLLTDMGYDIEIVVFEPSKTIPPFELNKKIQITNLFPVQFSGDGKQNRPNGKLNIQPKKIIKRIPNVLGLGFIKWRATHGVFSNSLLRHLNNVKSDIVCAFLPTAIAATGYACESQNIPFIASLHSAPSRDLGDKGRWDNNPYFSKMFSRALQTADHITLLQEKFIRELPKPLRSKAFVIPNMIQATPAHQTADFRMRRKTIINIGRLVDSKRHALLLSAWAEAKLFNEGWSLQIYGDGPNREALLSLSDTLDIANSVEINPSTEKIADVYASARILVHPSHYEGFGMVVAEALSYGVPCIGFEDCSGINTLITHQLNGFLAKPVTQEACQKDLAKVMRLLALDEPMQLQFSQAAPQSVMKYHPEQIKHYWDKLLRG